MSYRFADPAAHREELMKQIRMERADVVTDAEDRLGAFVRHPFDYVFVDSYCYQLILSSDIVAQVGDRPPIETHSKKRGLLSFLRDAFNLERVINELLANMDYAERRKHIASWIRAEANQAKKNVEAKFVTLSIGKKVGLVVATPVLLMPLGMLAALLAVLVVLPLAILGAYILLCVSFVRRALTNFAMRHVYGRSIRRMSDESWSEWEVRVAALAGRPVLRPTPNYTTWLVEYRRSPTDSPAASDDGQRSVEYATLSEALNACLELKRPPGREFRPTAQLGSYIGVGCGGSLVALVISGWAIVYALPALGLRRAIILALIAVGAAAARRVLKRAAKSLRRAADRTDAP